MKYIIKICIAVLGVLYAGAGCPSSGFAQQELESISTPDSNNLSIRFKESPVDTNWATPSLIREFAFFKMQSVLSDLYNVQIKHHKDLSATYYDHGQLDHAIRHAQTGLRYCNRFLHQAEIVSLNNLLGLSYYALGRFEDAYTVYLKALSFATEDSLNLGKIYNNVGNVLCDLGSMNRGKEYFQQAAAIGARYQDLNLLASALVNLSIHYKQLGDFAQAFGYTDSARSVAARLGDLNLLAGILINQAFLLCSNNEAPKALALLKSGDSLLVHPAVEAINKQGLNYAFGSTNYYVGNYALAKRYLEIAKGGVSVNQGLGGILFRLSQVHIMLQEYRDAYFVYRQFKEMEDSIASEQTALRVNELETQYRTAQKDKAIAEGLVRIQSQELRLNRQGNIVGGAVGGSLLLLLLASWRYTHMRQKNRRLQSQMEVEQLRAEMAGEQKERARIASELHDGIVAELTAIKMNLEVSGNKIQEAPMAYRGHLKELSTVINEVRNTAHNLMPEILLRHGLAEAAGLLCETIQKTGRLEVEYQHYGNFTEVPLGLRQSVYRIIQELLHNIIKHAKASKALVQLSCNDGLLAITVEDNGVGISVKQARHMGLESIRKRVKDAQGRVEWRTPKEGTGTSVGLEFDLRSEGDQSSRSRRSVLAEN